MVGCLQERVVYVVSYQNHRESVKFAAQGKGEVYMSDTNITFSETQSFSLSWLWVILFLAVIPGVLLMLYGMLQQLVYGVPFGSQPMPDGVLIATGLFALSVLGLLVWLFWKSSLVIEVREDELYVKYFPFLTRHFRYEDIMSCQMREYNPLLEFGGWGVRYNFRTWVYNVSGNEGVQLTFRERTPLLLGSLRSEELEAAISAKCKQVREK